MIPALRELPGGETGKGSHMGKPPGYGGGLSEQLCRDQRNFPKVFLLGFAR